MNNFTYSDELYHHGIKGMKWGIRRYQNEDGTLTPEGREHYGKIAKDSKFAFRRKDAEKKLKIDELVTENKLEKENLKRANNEIDSVAKMPARTNEERKAKIKAQEDLLERMDKSNLSYLLGAVDKQWIQTVENDVINKYGEKSLEEIRNTPSNERFYQNAMYGALQKQMESKSGSWYFGKPVTKDFKNAYDKYREVANKRMEMIFDKEKRDIEEYDRLREQETKLEDDLVGVALKDIGFEDTEKSRKLARDILIWD